jgi:hypothetical protein
MRSSRVELGQGSPVRRAPPPYQLPRPFGFQVKKPQNVDQILPARSTVAHECQYRDRSILMTRRSFVGGLATFTPTATLSQAHAKIWSGVSSGSDGSAHAPSGRPQYPDYFNALSTARYTVRPPWQVAGVDYRVGISAGVSLSDPATIPRSEATMFGDDPMVLNLTSDNVTLDGYDFTLRGWWQIRSNGHRNLTIRNSKLQNLCIYMDAGPLTVEYCEIDGLGAAGETVFGCLAFLKTEVNSTWKYNWLHSAQNDFIDLSTSDIDARFNLFDTMGYAEGAHADAIQFAGDGIANNIRILFNTYVHTKATMSGPSSFIDLETQVGSGTQMMNDPEIAYNTASNTAVGATMGSTFFRIAQDRGSINGAYVHDNFADPTNMISVIDSRMPGRGYRTRRNVLLTSGGSF